MADNLFIQIITKLNKQLSQSQIQTDIKNIENTPLYLRLIGRLNKALTRGQVERDIQDVQNTVNNSAIEVKAEINQNNLQRSFNEAMANIEQDIQNNPINIDVNANINNINTGEIIQGQQQIERNNQRMFNDLFTAHEVFQRITQAVKAAVSEIEKLNKAETDLQMVTQKSAAEMKSLMQDYNSLALEMGATTLEITDGASEWLRQGKSVEDTNTLIRDSMILSKISQMESSEATKYLTSAMNGYKTEVSDVINIVDKLNAVDLESASDAAGLAESLSRCANSANVAGISMDRLIGYISTVSEVTQKSASTVGEGFKSITARLQNIKANKFVDEDGTDISGEINDAEKILGKFNIALRDNAKEFRNAEDVMDDVAAKWHEMSSVEQSAIATAFGTVHQRENVIALFENYNRALELTEVSANSAGAAMEKFAVYENSLEAATNRLTASLQGIAYNTVDSNFLKNLANGTAQIVEFIDKTQLLKTGLTAGIFTGAISGLVALGTRMTAVRNNVVQFTQAMNLSRQTTAITETQFAALRINVQGLSEAQLRCVLSSRQLTEQQRIELMQAAGIEQARQQQLLQTWNLTNAENAQTTATFSLRGAWEGLKASIASNPIGLLVVGLTAATTVISNLKQKQEELRQSISDSAQAAKEQTDKLNDLIGSYEEFADKITYTAEEKEKLQSIQEQLIEAYHSEADNIDLVNGKYDEQIEKLRQLKKAKLEEAELSLVAEREQAKRDTSYDNLSNKSFDISADWFKSDDDYQKIVKELDERVSGFTTDIALIKKGMGIDSQINLYAGNVEYRIKQLQEAMAVLKENGYTNIGLYSQLNQLLSEYKELAETENSAISNLAENKFQQFELENPFDKVDGKDAYIAWKNSLLETAKGDTDLQDELSSLAEKQFPDYQKYFDNIAELKAKYVDTTVDVSKAISKMDFINSLSDEDLEIATQIPNLFKDGLDGATKAIEEWKNDPANKIETDVEINVDDTSLEDLQKAYDNISKSASSFTSSQKNYNTALKEMEEYGELSASTIQSLTEAGYGQALVLDTETEKVTLNTAEYEKLNQAKKTKLNLDIKQQNSDITKKIKEETAEISELKREYQALANANAIANEERLKEINIELAVKSQDVAELQDLLDKNNSLVLSLDAPTFESSTDKTDKTDEWKQEAEDKISEIEHLYAMEEITYEDYLNRLDEINQKYFADNTKYQDEYWKYEEKIYQGRKKLAQEAFDNEHELFEKRVDELEDYADKLAETSVTSDGMQLTTQEKWREVAAVYEEIQSEINREINRIVQAGVEGNEELLEELEKQLEEVAEKITDTFKSAVEEEKDFLNKQKEALSEVYDTKIDEYKELQENAENAANAEIDLIQEKIDSLKQVNDEKEREYEIEKARQELEKASQRTRMVYGANGTVTYRADTEAIKEAQENLNKLLLEQQIQTLEDQKSALEDIRDKESESYDAIIADLESQKEQDERQFDILIQRLDDYLNPDTSTSNADVWLELAKMDGATYKNGKWIDKDGTEIDIAALLNKADEISDKVENVDYSIKSETEKRDSNKDILNNAFVNKDNLKSVSLTGEEIFAKMMKLPDSWGKIVDSYVKARTAVQNDPVTTIQKKQDEEFNRVSAITNNNNRNITLNMGDIVIQAGNEVDAKKIAEMAKNEVCKEILLNLDNEVDKQIYSNLSKW